jgi:hypothetical protein
MDVHMELIIKVVKKFGKGSAHIVLPKKLIGKEVVISDTSDLGTKPMTWKTIEKLIDDKIEDAKHPY